MIAVAIILNGISRKKKKFYTAIVPVLTGNFILTIFETRWSGHARELALNASEKFDVILAAGGDGTLHEVINGVLQNKNRSLLPAIGVIPLGTGNDFARACGIRMHSKQLIALLEKNRVSPTDVGQVRCQNESGEETTEYFINECSIGLGPEVVRRLSTGNRKWGPHITYFKAIVASFLRHRPQHVICKTAGWAWEGKSRVLAIANGVSFGNAIYIAPDAHTDDGLLNIFVADNVSLWRFLLYLHALMGKRKLSNNYTFYQTANYVHLESSEATALEADGELVGYLPATIELLARRINFLT